MGAIDPRLFLKLKGRISADPTDLTLAYPHGGTSLGSVMGLKIIIDQNRENSTFEEFGGDVGEVFKAGQRVRVGCFARGYDPDLLGKVFDSTSTTLGGDQTSIKITYPGANKEGRLGSADTFKLLFTPDSPTAPAFILYAAIPLLEESSEILLRSSDEYGYPLIFEGIRDDTLGTYQSARIEDMDIT